MFHEVMGHYQSIVIQPSGKSLERSCKLDQPVFTLREKPVKEQYKLALKKINEMLYPEKYFKVKKVEQSISNMMVSNKGTALDQ